MTKIREELNSMCDAVGVEIKSYCEKKEITLYRFSVLAGVEHRCIYDLVNKKHKHYPKATTVRKIRNVLLKGR